MLIPIEGENTQIEGAKEDGAHPDISSRGLWSPFERTFYDVQVIHPNSPSYLDTTPKQLLVQKEKIKMRKYNVRALQVEKGTFTPLLYTTFGGWGPQATAYHRRLVVPTRASALGLCFLLPHRDWEEETQAQRARARRDKTIGR